MSDNPYSKKSVSELKAIEEDLLMLTRNPHISGARRRVEMRKLRQVRQALKNKR